MYVCIACYVCTEEVNLLLARVHKREEKRVSNCLKAVFEVQRSPDILLYSSYHNTLSNCSTKHMQVYFVLKKEVLQAGIVELDTLLSLSYPLLLLVMYRFI